MSNANMCFPCASATISITVGLAGGQTQEAIRTFSESEESVSIYDPQWLSVYQV